jgi:hypothetical protein
MGRFLFEFPKPIPNMMVPLFRFLIQMSLDVMAQPESPHAKGEGDSQEDE